MNSIAMRKTGMPMSTPRIPFEPSVLWICLKPPSTSGWRGHERVYTVRLSPPDADAPARPSDRALEMPTRPRDADAPAR
eukprot:770034-Prorocentrum_minimum.AAC.1